jgi:hypothetical protein
MEMRAIDFIQPDFAKIDAPSSGRADFWQDVALETRAAGLDPQWAILSGLDKPSGDRLARDAGFGFGQGDALKRAYPPPSTRERLAGIPEQSALASLV